MELIPRSSSVPDRGPLVLASSYGFAALALVMASLRISRRAQKRQLGWDDALVGVATLLAIGVSANYIIAVKHFGYGHHTRDLTPKQRESHGAAIGYFVAQILYKFSIMFTKCSILMLYRRIAIKAVQKRALYFVMSIVVAFYAASEFVTIFQCRPISKSWIKTEPGHCIDVLKFYYANACMSIITDVMILVLPIPVLKSLNIPLREKISLGGLFLLGSGVCIISGLRLRSLSVASKPDTPWDTSITTVWTEAEMATAISCASLPIIRGLIFPKRMTRKTSAISTAPTYVDRFEQERSMDTKKQTAWPKTAHGSYGFDGLGSEDDMLGLVPVHGRTHSSIHALSPGHPRHSDDQATLRDAEGEVVPIQEGEEEGGIRKTTNFDITYQDKENV